MLTAPPEIIAAFPLNVLFSTAAVARLSIPPPKFAELLLIVLSITVIMPELSIPPPKNCAEFPLRVLLVTKAVPELEMPPPNFATFPIRLLLVTVAVAPEETETPPPKVEFPPVIVNASRVAVPLKISNTPEYPAASIVMSARLSPPTMSPSIITSSISVSPFPARVIVEPARVALNVIVSASASPLASAIASRRLIRPSAGSEPSDAVSTIKLAIRMISENHYCMINC